MACAQTGSGKTAAFLLPLISKLLQSPPPPTDRFSRKAFPLALVLAPTRELACQIQDECKKFAFRTGLKSAVVYGGSPIGYQLRTLEQGCDILVATPGRLVDIMDRDKVSLAQIKFLVLDEADRMLDMGFEPQIRKIVEHRDMTRRGIRRTLMFSATFPKEIQQLASQFLEDYIFLAVGRVGSTTDLVTQHFVKCDEYEKSNALLKLVRESQGLTLIFVETKKQAESLGNLLASKGFPATSIHGDRAQKDRTAAIRTFSTGKTPFLVATNVAARGLDIENIAHVINYDMPGDIDDYVHRIGRTGRAGKPGMSTSLITPANANIIPKLIEILEEAGQELPRWLDEMKFDRSYKKPRHFGRGPKFGGTDFRRDGGFHNAPRPPPSFGGGDGRGYPGGGAYGQYPPRPQGYGAPPPPSGPAPPGPARPYGGAPSSSYGPPAPGYSSSGYSQPSYPQGGGGAPQSYGPTPPTTHRGAYSYKPY
jgi:ATP-dependent RNA helicase DDX3X